MAYIVTPLLLMAILRPASETLLQAEGFPKSVNGSEQVVPAFCAMFVFMWPRSIGERFFAEHGWGTWERLQMSFAQPAQILAGILVPGFVIIMVQQAVLFLAGTLIFDLNANGAVWALPILAVALTLCSLALTLALVGVLRTAVQLEAVGTLVALLFAALGGSLVASFTLPELAQDIAPVTPVYWALEAARDVILENGGAGDVIGRAAVLLGFSAVFLGVAAATFRFADKKGVE
jgi:ABC-2 type transport system permease protein